MLENLFHSLKLIWMKNSSRILIIFLSVLVLLAPLIEVLFNYEDKELFYISENFSKGSKFVSFLYKNNKDLKSNIYVIGNSATLSSFDLPYINKYLKENSNGHHKVVNISHPGNSISLDYFHLKSLIANKSTKPNLVILGSPLKQQESFHVVSRYFYRFNDLLEESKIFKMKYLLKRYFSTIISAITRLSIFVTNQVKINYNSKLVQNLGSSYFEEKKFELNEVLPNVKEVKRPVIINKKFTWLSSYQLYYLNKIKKLCKENQIKIGYFVFPTETNKNGIQWDSRIESDTSLVIGIPYDKMKVNLPQSQNEEVTFKGLHFGRKTATLHSKLIAPQFLRLIHE